MIRRFGWFYKALRFGGHFAQVKFEDNSVQRVHAATERGSIVYVLRYASAVDHLALNTVLNRSRLPLSVWSNGVNSFWWQPIKDAWRDLWARLRGDHKDPVESGWLALQVAAGNTVTLFLEEGEEVDEAHDPFAALIEAQGRSARPVQIIPIVVQWHRGPQLHGAVRNFLLNRQSAPGIIGQLRHVWFNSPGTVIQAGEPLDLEEFTRRARPEIAVRTLRTVLRRYLKRESRIIQGPRILSYQAMRSIVLDSPPLRQLAQEQATTRQVSVERVRQEMAAEYKIIAARFRWWVVRTADVVLRPLWTKIYSGVDVRPEDIERIREAMRSGTAVVIPCHKSHFDYLLISWVFYINNLIVPHVIAGANLNIFLVNHFFRSVGGFFIKRSFHGEPLHPAVFERYLRELIFQGYPVEFYIEGGRTRSGKLLPAKVGVLSMLFDAAKVRPRDHEVTLLPVSLAYEEVAEQGAYVREAGGEEKKPENLGQVLQARSVLSRRFGRVYLRVGEPIRCSSVVDVVPDRVAWKDQNAVQRKGTLDAMGRRIMHRIGQVTVVLPTCLCAAALLAHHRRGIRHDELLERIRGLRALVNRRGAMEAASLLQFDQAVLQALDRFARDKHIEAFELEGHRVWSIKVESRLQLEFYKNQLIHFLVPAGLTTLCIRSLEGATFKADELVPRLGRLRTIWDREFPFDPDQSTEELLEVGLGDLVVHGALTLDDEGTYAVGDVARIGEIHGLFKNFVETYRVVLAGRHEHAPLVRKTYVKQLAADGDRYLATGLATRPEALSTITMASAVSALIDLGCFDKAGDGLGINEEACLALDAELAPMVD